MDWKELKSAEQLTEIKEHSKEKPQVIFKHSTRCSISSMAKSRLERAQTPLDVEFYFLDLLKYRNISRQVEADFAIDHESPQVLLIKNGKCVYNESHSGISMDDIKAQALK